MIAMSMPRVPAFQPRVQENRGEDKQTPGQTGTGSRVDVLANPLAPIYGDQQGGGGGGGNNAGGNAGSEEDQLARLLAGADSGQIRAWAGNISQNNARKAQELFPNTNPLKFVGAHAVPGAYEALSLSELNRRNYGGYMPWVESQTGDMTPLSGNRIIVAGDPFSLKHGVVDSNNEDAIPVEWQNQMNSEWREVQLNQGPAGSGSYNRQHLAMGRFSMSANPHLSSSTLLPS
jgi:hypothetical protein